MAESSIVSAGDDILASQYNNLRKDVIDTALGHTHNGVDSKTLAADSVSATQIATNVDVSAKGFNSDKLDGFHAGNETGKVPVSNGTVNTDLNADKLDGFHAGNETGKVPVSNGAVNTDLNADKVDGFHATDLTATPIIYAFFLGG